MFLEKVGCFRSYLMRGMVVLVYLIERKLIGHDCIAQLCGIKFVKSKEEKSYTCYSWWLTKYCIKCWTVFMLLINLSFVGCFF